MNGDGAVQELETGVIVLGAAYFGLLLSLIVWLAP